ncbi:FAD-dependent oxidoreductase, partial [Roseomonas sp. DSM 102946]|nr:FAD-dependent oxidoreductase [Roseomonas sp. DSM 102946]
MGGGMFGQTAGFALIRDGIRNIRVIDRARRGEEGPWGTYARMPTLRSPKHLTGPDLGIPSLTFRAWWEAQHGAEGWERLYKIHRLDWLAYLLWVRDAAAIPVENETALVALEPVAEGLLRAGLRGPQGEESLLCRQVVLAGGREGVGGPNIPPFPSLPRGLDAAARATGRVFHSVDPVVDFGRFRGRRIAVLGANASAFDNAGTALEAGAAKVTMFARRAFLPQVNKTRGMVFSGFLRGFGRLDDATRWRFLTY